MNYNSWLVEHGYMTIVGDAGETKTLEDLFETRQLFEKVDWSRTRAYAMGLGGIYVNLAGRETKGSVQPGAEYDALMAELTAGLEAAVDPATGERPVTKVQAGHVCRFDLTSRTRAWAQPGYRSGGRQRWDRFPQRTTTRKPGAETTALSTPSW
jgi:predicted AlkP superfamily phosphohydrolase/phosphomutase